jgi:hypothetical protein
LIVIIGLVALFALLIWVVFYRSSGTTGGPAAAGFASLLVPSIIDAKFQAQPKCKIPTQCTALSGIQPQKSTTRFYEDTIF